MAKYYDRCWNPIFGCNGNFTGCANCYAKSLLKRRTNDNYDFTKVKLNESQYKKKFDKEPKLIAVCTQSDLFQDNVKENIINGVLRKCNNINYNRYLFLTKYSGNMKDYFNCPQRYKILNNNHINQFKFDNMIFGVTVCDNNDLYRIDDLHNTKLIKHRFISFEPVYDRIKLTTDMLKDIEWIIVGGETGDNPHYCKEQWIIEIIDKANELNIPVFVNAIHTEGGKVTTEFEEMNIKLHRNEIPFKFY